MAVKEYRPPIKGTCVCHWCGCTNHSDSLKQTIFFRIDGIMGDAYCWDLLKKFLMEIGVAEEKTLMRDIVKELKKAKRLVIMGQMSDYMGKNGLLSLTTIPIVKNRKRPIKKFKKYEFKFYTR